MSHHIGVLAYGSLINDPGEELSKAIVHTIKDVETPFRVEFARSSAKRGGGPTLIPVENGGSFVMAQVLVISDTVGLDNAVDMVWRRETDRVGSGERYGPPTNPTVNAVLVDRLADFSGLETVLYTRIASNIAELTVERLADLAIASVKTEAGLAREDGISYLAQAIDSGIRTELSPAYEREVLNRLGVQSLKEAWLAARQS